MRTLYTVAYPELDVSDAEFIARFRDQHDLPYRDVVGAHFTLVFGYEAEGEAAYLDHVKSVVARRAPIDFHCRYAMLGDDATSDTAHVFLVPDEGYSSMSLLHDSLYRELLADYLRLDVAYTPHITIGTLEDSRVAKRLCDELNEQKVDIRGRVDAVTVGALVGGTLEDVATFPLAGEG